MSVMNVFTLCKPVLNVVGSDCFPMVMLAFLFRGKP